MIRFKEALHNSTKKTKEYLNWKRKNVTLRGMMDPNKKNEYYGSFGKGLYTTFLSNKSMARQYGRVYFVVNAIPKKPKIVYNLNEAEILRQNLVNRFCKKNNHRYSVSFFEEHTSMDAEMKKLGYDGLIIKGREMVNYKPTGIKYFETEEQLKSYFENIKFVA
jgi:hypothetical protein